MLDDVSNILPALYEIKNTSGSNAKKEVMKKHMQQDWFISATLMFLLDDLKPTGIGKKSWNKAEASELTIEQEPTYLGFVNWLSQGGHSSNEDVVFAKSLESELGELAYILATKDISLGVKANTYNKIAEEIGIKKIPVVSPMLSKNIDSISEKNLENMFVGGAFVTEKLDGIRAIAINNNGEWKITSRSGKEINGLEHIKQALDDLINVSNSRVYDGELVIPSYLNAEDAFRETAGVVNSNGDKSSVVFNVFDAPLASDFFGDTKHEIYLRRRNHLDRLSHNNTPVQPVPVLGLVYSFDELQDIFDKMIKNGAEGIMINTNTVYQPKRTANLLKMKQQNSVDLRVVSIEEGQGKNAGKVGALVMMYKGNELRVGSGLTDSEREFYWNAPDFVVGRIIEIGYTTESQDKDGKKSLRFPRFIGFRDDKDEESYE